MDSDTGLSKLGLMHAISRRRLLKLSVVAGVSLPVLGLLAACGGDDEEPASTATSGTSGAASTATSATTGGSGATPSVAGSAASPAGTTQATSGGTPKMGGTLRMAFRQAVADTLDQHISNHTQSRMVARHMLDCLTYVDVKRDNEVTPWLADSWEISTNGLQYTLKLKSGVTFHDGTPFNGAAVKKNFDYTMDPNTRHGFAYAALGGEKYDRLDVVDDLTVKITLKQPYGMFLPALSDGGTGIDSPAALEEYGTDYGVKAVVGTGPYKFVEWVKGDHTTMTRNPDYKWGPPMAGHQGPGYVDTIIFRDIGENATLAAALQNGDIDMGQMVQSQAAQFEGSKDVSIILRPNVGTSRMYLMNGLKSPTDDIKVRQALCHGVDFASLVKLPAWSNIGRAATAPLPANVVPNGDLSSLRQYFLAFDQNKAKQLLDEAGWTMGSGGVRMKNGQEMVLDYVLPQGEVPFAEPITGMISQLGIKVNVQPGDFNFWIDTVGRGEFHVTPFSDSGFNIPVMLHEFFHSEGPYNNWGQDDPAIDAEIDAAAAAADPEVRWEHLFKAMALIMPKVPGMWGWEQDYVFGANNKVKEPGFNESNYPYFYDTWIEG